MMDTKGFKVGDKVTRGKGKKVMTITGFRPAWPSTGEPPEIAFAGLNGGSLYNVAELRHAVQTAPAEPALSATISVYRLATEHAELIKAVPLIAPKAELLETLAAVRSGLPPDCGASLTDGRGNNICP